MQPPSDDTPTPEFADQVDDALEAMWHGDSAEMNRLVESDEDGAGAPGIGTLFGSVIGLPAGLAEGAVIGGYAVERLIAHGGMGSVYLAMQHNPRRTVALKVMKAGIASRSALRRFEHESQILARLRHPNIAQVYEAGTHHISQDGAEPGVPFFAMEYIPGAAAITDYAVSNKLSTRERLELLAKVCDAVHHGHEQGIIHRDLKPGNILVDSTGEPKIIDFGVARATDSDIAVTTLRTDVGQLIGTLQYMSPEQCDADAGSLDARSDVYALGVVMYELLCGRLPYDLKRTALYDAARVIRDQSPIRLSEINRMLRGDVETIVLKALEKDRNRRYLSAADLRDDIRRYLSDQPILARSSSAFYRLRKKAARHRSWVVLAVVLVSLVALAAVRTVWVGQRDFQSARHDALVAQCELDIGLAENCLDSAGSVLTRYPDLTEAILASAHARFQLALDTSDEELMGTVTTTLRSRIDNDPQANWACSALLTEMYRAAGEEGLAEHYEDQVRRFAPETAQAWYVRSFATLDKKQAIYCAEQAAHLGPGRRLAPLIWKRLSQLYLHTRDYEGAMEAVRMLNVLGGDRLHTMRTQASILIRQGRYNEAIPLCDRVIELDQPHPHRHRARAIARLCLKQYDKSIEDYSTAVELAGPQDTWERHHRATPLWIVGRHEEAADDYREVRRIRGHAHWAGARLFLVLHDQADHLERQGFETEAASLRAEADLVLEQASRIILRGSWLEKALACLAGDLTPAELFAAADPDNDQQVCEACYYAGEASLLQGRPNDARQWFQRCADTGLALDPDLDALNPMNEYHLALWRLDSLTQ
ncbi:MAG: protein kinase [Phycisphaerales bacterium]|nr:protein kinase [Phycisphaerales bacterium]